MLDEFVVFFQCQRHTKVARGAANAHVCQHMSVYVCEGGSSGVGIGVGKQLAGVRIELSWEWMKCIENWFLRIFHTVAQIRFQVWLGAQLELGAAVNVKAKTTLLRATHSQPDDDDDDYYWPVQPASSWRKVAGGNYGTRLIEWPPGGENNNMLFFSFCSFGFPDF